MGTPRCLRARVSVDLAISAQSASDRRNERKTLLRQHSLREAPNDVDPTMATPRRADSYRRDAERVAKACGRISQKRKRRAVVAVRKLQNVSQGYPAYLFRVTHEIEDVLLYKERTSRKPHATQDKTLSRISYLRMDRMISRSGFSSPRLFRDS